MVLLRKMHRFLVTFKCGIDCVTLESGFVCWPMLLQGLTIWNVSLLHFFLGWCCLRLLHCLSLVITLARITDDQCDRILGQVLPLGFAVVFLDLEQCGTIKYVVAMPVRM